MPEKYGRILDDVGIRYPMYDIEIWQKPYCVTCPVLKMFAQLKSRKNNLTTLCPLLILLTQRPEQSWYPELQRWAQMNGS